jgi:prepilin signal peptidase PulO-like enzyme (type II secretory pathway)
MNDSVLALGLAALLGLMIGSFLNVVIHRLPLMLQAQWDPRQARYPQMLPLQSGCAPLALPTLPARLGLAREHSAAELPSTAWPVRPLPSADCLAIPSH